MNGANLSNLGNQINTASGDELFPFIHSDGSLYFASNGHVGMGGMDIYKAEFDTEELCFLFQT